MIYIWVHLMVAVFAIILGLINFSLKKEHSVKAAATPRNAMKIYNY